MYTRPPRTQKAWAVYLPSGRMFCAKVEKSSAIRCAMDRSQHPLETWDDYLENGWTIEEVEVRPSRLTK